MQTCFLAPHVAKPHLAGATLLSAMGMSNSATAGWHGWDHRQLLQHCRSWVLGCCIWLPSCRVCSCPHRAIGADGAWFLMHRNSQVGTQCWPHIRATGSELERTETGSGLVTCAEQALLQWSPADLGPAQYNVYVLHFIVKAILRGIRHGCKTWVCSFI